jgi:hypothetical protein
MRSKPARRLTAPLKRRAEAPFDKVMVPLQARALTKLFS